MVYYMYLLLFITIYKGRVYYMYLLLFITIDKGEGLINVPTSLYHNP